MPFPMPFHPTRICGGLAAGLLILGLAACGGGGGSAGSAPPPSVAISAANQDAVTRAAFAGTAAGSLGSLTGIGSGSASAALSRSALKQALSAAGALRKRIAADVSADLCPAGGSASASINDTLPIGELNAGDAISIRYTSCNVGDGVIVGGNLDLAYTTVTDDQLGADVALSGLSVSDTATGYSATSDGGFSLSLTATSTTTLVSELLVPDQLVMSSAHLGSAIDTITLLDGYSVHSTAVSTTGTTTTIAAGPVASAAAGGFVTIETAQALVQLDSENYPRAGRVMVTGLRGTLRATVLSATQVAIDLDANDDGGYEASKTVAWNTLL